MDVVKKKKVKIFRYLFLAIVIFIVAINIKLPMKYDVPDETIYKEIDVSKKGNKFDMNISIRDDAFYRFMLVYAVKDIETDIKEGEIIREAAKKGVDNFDKLRCYAVSTDKIAGIYGGMIDPIKIGEDEYCIGSKIVLRLKVHSIDKKFNYEYVRGDTVELRMVLDTNSSDDLVVDMDMSKFGEIYSSFAPNKTFARYKKIAAVVLYRGDYQISIETLTDTPEAKDIVTYIAIQGDSYGK